MNILAFNNLESALNIICCLPDLYQMLRLNRYKYSKMHIKCKLSLSVEDVVSEVYLIILIKAL